MAKRTRYLIVILPVLLTLAACASLKLSGTGSPASQNPSDPLSNLAGQPLEDKLAIGTLELEGTGQAVSPAQAKTLLPLWKAVKTLSASNSTAAAEMTALYSQIKAAMTSQQIQAIQDLNLSASDLQTLLQKYRSPQAGSSGQKSTQSALSSQLQGGGFGGGPGGDPGSGPGGGGGAPPDAGGGIFGASPKITTTPVAGRAGAANQGRMNLMFVDPIIQLLTQRAGA
jgi:hypothetical protein